MHERKTLTVNLPESEMAILEELSRKKAKSKAALMRQALRLYELIDARLEVGERLVIENDKARRRSEMMVL